MKERAGIQELFALGTGARMQQMARQAIYLDHNATAPLLPEARAALLSVLDLTGNPSSVHAHGRAARERLEMARGQVATLTGAEPRQIVFTSSATEAINQAVVGGARTLGVDGILVSAGEHVAVLRAAEATGLPVRTLGLDAEGRIDIAELRAELAAAEGRTLLVAVHWVNNETGVVQPMGEICALVGASRHFLFVDWVQALGKLPLAFASSAPDMVAVSAHKIGAPAGAGALLVKAHADAVRLVIGGGQEQGRRAGTEATATIAAFGAACEAFPAAYEAADVARLAAAFEVRLSAVAPEARIFGSGVERIGNTVAFAVPGLTSAVAMMGLDLEGISVSSGSACSSGKVAASHVLKAMGISPELAECALRVSLGWSSRAEDIEAFFAAFETILSRHRARRGQAA